MKGPKRKRLAKACDACHKSKRRCDGTAPCSNCYFASKKCTYTDASGKPVPAPRPRAEGSSDPRPGTYPHPDGPLSNTPPAFGNMLPQNGDSPSVHDSDDDRIHPRKRLRPDLIPSTPPRSLAPPVLPPSDRPLERDPALTRELIHLFFTYRQPQRMIIHQARFLADLSRNAVPPYLLLAVCAVAAPLSKQPKLKTSPSRYAGERFAQEAIALMYKDRNLNCEPNLATAQALCLLQLHDRMGKSLWNGPYYEHAMNIVTNLGIFESDYTVLTPDPSPEFINAAIDRECARRVFWLIFISDCVASVLYRRNILATESQLSLRLPMDETCFELSPHTALPEFMIRPISPTVRPVLSEIGQLIQILTIHEQIERTMDDFNNRENGRYPGARLLELEKEVTAWAQALPDHLRFTDENLTVQTNVYETASNTGAWCFAAMHTFHNSCILALNWARQRCRSSLPQDTTGAQEKLHMIVREWGGKVKLSILLGLILWPLFKYTDDRSSVLLEWSSAFEEVWGVRIQDLCPAPGDSRHQLFSISHIPPTPPSSLTLAPRVPPPSGVPPGPGMISISVANPGVPPRASGPESTPSIAMPSQFPLQSRAALEPRFHSHSHTQPPLVPQTHPQPGVGHPAGADQREKENGRNVHAGHDGGIDPVVTHASASASASASSVSGSTAPSNGRVQAQQGASSSTGNGNGQQAPQQSLPSLKASGLLEWPLPGSAEAPGVQVAPPPSASISTSASAAWAGGVHSLAPPPRAGGREPARSPRSQAPVQSPSQTHAQLQGQAPSHVPLPPAQPQSEAGSERGGPSSGMPVGLQWLAHESTVARQS